MGTDLPRTRLAAKNTGQPRYFTGKPCKHGHVGARKTASGHCVECDRLRSASDGRAMRAANPEKVRAYQREYQKSWYAAQGEPLRKYYRDRAAAARSTPRGRLDNAITAGVSFSLAPGSKAKRSTFSLLGYSLTELMSHLEAKFSAGMTWANYGRKGWHVDHIIPKSAFNYETPDDLDFKRCWALDNLQPLWEFDNISKGDDLSTPFQPSLLLAAPTKRTA